MPFETIPIPPDFHLKLSTQEIAAYPPQVVSEVDRIWKEVCDITDWGLFDGKVFQLDELHEGYLTGVFNDYRFFYAQNQYPELKEVLNITLVGVTGILECDGLFLLGKRSHKVTQYPGMWEFAPSGGISIDFLCGDTIEYEKQLFEELTQEVGMEWDFVTEIKPLMLIRDKRDQTIDVCALMQVESIGRATASYQSPEYSAYEWLRREQIASFLKEKEVVPTTQELLNTSFFL